MDCDNYSLPPKQDISNSPATRYQAREIEAISYSSLFVRGVQKIIGEKSMRRFSIGLFWMLMSILVILPGIVQAQTKTLTLDDCIEMALKNHQAT